MNRLRQLFANIFALALAIPAAIGEALHRTVFGYMVRSGLVLSARDGLTSQDFAANRVTNPAQSEIIRNTIYDSLLYPTAGQGQLIFFQQPIGAGTTSALGATVGSTKSLADTNMNLPGSLPSGKQYVVESIEVLFKPGSVSTANTYTPATIANFNAVASASVFAALNDVNTFYQSGWLEFNILSKNYLQEAPLVKFPPKCEFEAWGGAASNSATTATVGFSTAKAVGRPYFVEPKITLQPTVNWDVTLKWPGAVATPSGFNGRVVVTLDGGFMRASQ